jgi:hypothetical protein
MKKQRRQAMPSPDKTPDAPAAPQASSANVMQPFLEARIAYYSRLNENWQAAQRNVKDSYCAHAKTQKSLLDEMKQGASEAAGRYQEGLRAGPQEQADERHRAAASALSRYQMEMDLAKLAASQKWLAHSHDLSSTVTRAQESYAERSREEYRNYVEAVKRAWQSLDVAQLRPELLSYIAQLNDEIALFAWYTGGGR